MLVNILGFIYVFILSFFAGSLLLSCFPSLKNKKVSLETIILLGLSGIGVYSEFFSLFYKVGLVANVCLIVLLLLASLLNRNFKNYLCLFSKKKVLVCMGLLLLFSYGTSTGMMHYDTGLYHAQAIRWIEEYGVVKGLGVLHYRFGYNSAAFVLTALFSFPYIFPQSLHFCAGFIAYILSLKCVDLFSFVKRKKLLTSDFVKLVGLIYLYMIFDEMVSPASDYYAICLGFFVLISWLEMVESKEENEDAFGILCLIALFSVTVKLSMAPLVLLTIFPLIKLIKKKREKTIWLFVGLGLLFVAPYFIRNYFISGYLLYPSTFPDLFNVDWKVPKEIALFDKYYIISYGRGYSDKSGYFMSFKEWIPTWFSSLSFVDKVFTCGSVISIPACIAGAFLENKNKDKKGFFESEWFVGAVVIVAFIYFMLSSPLIRYGCLFIWLPSVIVFGKIVLCMEERTGKASKAVFLMAAIAFSLSFSYKTLVFLKETGINFNRYNLLLQEDYETEETDSIIIDHEKIYYSLYGDKSGYDPFPCVPSITAGLRLRGTSLKEGFYVEKY